MKQFIRKYENRIHGALSCFDRMLFRGYLPIMSGWAMAGFLYRLNVNFGNIDHVGSTSVPGLAAKPIIDILLVVANTAAKTAYVPALEVAGYVLRIRVPDWYEHRMFKGPDTDINLHCFSDGCPEI